MYSSRNRKCYNVHGRAVVGLTRLVVVDHRNYNIMNYIINLVLNVQFTIVTKVSD